MRTPRDWYGMSEYGRQFGAREMVSPTDGNDDVDVFIAVAFCLGDPDIRAMVEFHRGYLEISQVREELSRRLGGRALRRAIDALNCEARG